MLMITLLEVFEEANIQLMEVLEKFLCAKDTAVNGANKMKESVASLERKIGDVEQTANAAATATTVTQLNADLIRLNASVDMLKDDVTEIEDKLDFAIASIDAIIGVV
jgi:archaellum component FlaC